MGLLTGYFSLVGVMDGPGYESIYKLTSTRTAPDRPLLVNTDGHVPEGWSAVPLSVSESYPYQWVCQRKKEEGVWGMWSDPAIYSNFADGIKSIINYYALSSSSSSVPSSWSLTPPKMTSTMKYLWNYEVVELNVGGSYETDPRIIGVYGDDGVGIDYIREYYLATSQGSGVTTSTSGWTMSIQTISPDKKYLWNYEAIMYTSGYREVSDPRIIGVYGDKGDPGEPGEPGTDGKGYEYCYTSTSYNSRPSTPTSSDVDGSVPSGWYSTPPDVSAVNAYVWESQRTKTNGSWSSWSTPKLKNRWANDGAQGGKGAKMRMREWSSGTKYLQGKDGEDFYDIVLYNSKLYLCLKSHTASSSNNPVTSINNYLGYWEIAQEWTFVATKLLLTEKIVASQIDANGIVAENVDLSGKITATSGKIGGWSISGNNLECEGFDTKILVEASGTRFMRINAEEKIMCYVRSDESTGISIAVYGNTDDAVGLNVLCNSRGKGYAIYSRGNVMLNAREGERVELYGLTVNVRKVNNSSNFALQTNDDFIEFNNASAMTFNMSSNSRKGKIIYMKKISVGNNVTLTGGFRNPDGVGVSTTLTIGDEKSRIFVYDGSYWVQFYCG